MIKYLNTPADYDHCNYGSDTDSMQFPTAHQAYYDRDRDSGHIHTVFRKSDAFMDTVCDRLHNPIARVWDNSHV